jgi:type I restriction enzyme M protein
LDGSVVSSEYTVLRAKDSYDPEVLQLIIRSPEVRADLLLSASGANRTRTRWELMKDLLIPYPNQELVTQVKQLVIDADHAKRRSIEILENARAILETHMLLRDETADTILAAFRPPK